MPSSIVSTFMHVLELAVLLAASYFAMRFLGIESEALKDVVLLGLATAAKFARASDLPIKDFVNDV